MSSDRETTALAAAAPAVSAVAAAATDKPSASAGWGLAGLALASLASNLGISIGNIALPTLAQTFNASFQEVQWVILAYLLMITTMSVSAGRLGDMMGRRRVLLAGLGVYTLASVLCGAASSLWLLIAARALQGLGAAALLALSMALVSETVPKNRAGAAMGLLGTMAAIGTTLGPSLGGVLIEALGWRAVFWVKVPVGLLALFIVYRYLPAQRGDAAPRAGFDALGTLLLALTLGAYALAVTTGRGNFGTVNAALLIAAVIGAGVFVYAESKAASPLLRPAMFRDRILTAGLVTSGLVSTVMITMLVVGPFYLSAALGLNAAAVGLVVAAGPLAAALGSAPAGRLVDRFGAQRMCVFGLAGMVAGCFMLSLLPTATGVYGYVVCIVTITTGYSLFQTANNTAVMADVAPDQRGVVAGTLNLIRNLGLISGASVMGGIFALASSAPEIARATAAEVTKGLHVTIAVAGVLIVIALAIALRAYRGVLRAPAAR